MNFWKNWRARSEVERQIKTHMPMLERIVASYESRLALQQELMQEVVLAIWQAQGKFQGNASIKTYFARIAHNRCVSHVDKAVKDLGDCEFEDKHSDNAAPSQQLQQEQQWQQLMQAVRQLPLQQKQVISLLFEGFSYHDIADICGMTQSHVGVLINRTKAVLTEQLQDL